LRAGYLYSPGIREEAFSETGLPLLAILGKGMRLSRLQPFDMFEDSVESYTDRQHQR
jgi:hypothetical protein